MKSIVTLRAARFLFAMLLASMLAGCGSALQKVVREEAAAPGGYVVVDAPELAGRIRVTRGGQDLPPRLPLMLKPGDVIETGPGTAAVLRLEQGEAVLGPETRVRIGSLEVIFGRIFASVRGLFRAEDGNLAADVEGTRFGFESQRGGATRVVVLDGAVRCSPKAGGWAPVRVRAGHTMVSSGSAHPGVSVTTPGEREEILHWSRAIAEAPRAGYCCADGRVFGALSNACRGRFERSEAEARRQCARGWCCDDGEVTETLRAECGGTFHDERGGAERACVSAQGWCCANGELSRSTREKCRGQFHANGKDAERYCASPPASQREGWCCVVVPGTARGRVWQTDRAACEQRQGRFHSSQAAAERSCSAIH